MKGILEGLHTAGRQVCFAVTNILYGIVNPSGKLAETIPVKQLTIILPELLAAIKWNMRECICRGYRYYDTKQMEVAYPFGYGLSYTTFTYSNLQISNTNQQKKDTITVSVDVTSSE